MKPVVRAAVGKQGSREEETLSLLLSSKEPAE